MAEGGRSETYTSESIAPERSESIWRELRVTDRVHDVAVAEIRLDRTGVHAVVGKVEARGVPKHVWVDWQADVCVLPCPRHQLMHRGLSDRAATLGDE